MKNALSLERYDCGASLKIDNNVKQGQPDKEDLA
jgi:hypothetical protein